MAGMNPPLTRPRQGMQASPVEPRTRTRRLFLSWEDWLTLGAAALVYVSLAYSIQSAELVRDMPALVPTTIGGLLIGLFTTRLRASQFVLQPLALVAGLVVIVLMVQQYADGLTFADRISDTQFRMKEWASIIWAGDISNDNLPFVFLVHVIAFLLAYTGTWAIFRWHNAWLAIIPAGAILLANISALRGEPAALFVVYLFGALLLVARIHLQKRQQAWQRSGVEYPEFISFNVAQLTALVAAALMALAWAVPLGTQAAAAERTVDTVLSPFSGVTERMGRVFHNVDAGNSGNFHKFGDALPIRGDVGLGSRELYQVSGFDTREGLRFLRGTSYDEYTGVGWKATDRDQSRLEGGEIQVQGDLDYLKRVFSTLQVTITDSDSVVLFEGIPFGSNLQTIAETPGAFAGDIEQLRPRRGLNEGDEYSAVGTVSAATEADLRAATDPFPAWVTDRYLQLPDSLPERVSDLASEVAAGTSNNYDAAVAIEAYLRAFQYDLSVPAAPANRDAVDYLLFDLKAGYFDYQASAMAVMLRTLGIPARVAVGYAIDPANDIDGAPYRVTKADAYSWVEAFFPGYGWIEFNPTGDRPQAGRVDPAVSPGLEGDEGPFLTDDSDIDFGIEELPEDIGGALSQPPVIQGEGFPMWILWTLLGAAAVIGLTVGGAYTGWNWGLGGLSPRGKLWAKAQRLGRFAGLGVREAETAREWSRRVGKAVGQEDAARSLASAYEASRYGKQSAPPVSADDEDPASGAYRTLRGRLLKRVVKRGGDIPQ